MADRFDAEQSKLITWSLVILAAGAIAAYLHFTSTVMIPFVLAVFVTSLISPLVDYLVVQLKWPRVVSIIAAMLVVVGIVAIFGCMVLVAAQTVNATVKEYSENFTSMSKELLGRLEQLGIDQEQVTQDLNARIPSAATKTIGTITGLIGNGALVLVFAAFLLAGRSVNAPSTGIYREIDSKVRRYLAIKVMISAITGLAVWILLAILGLGVRIAFVFGMMTFALNFIPSLGSILATLLPIPVAVAKFGSIWMILLVVGLPGSVQLLMGNIIEPKLQGEGLKLHPVVILLSLALWGLLWGIAGMLLAVPLTAVIRIVLLQFDTTKPIGKLLAGELPSVDLKKEDK